MVDGSFSYLDHPASKFFSSILPRRRKTKASSSGVLSSHNQMHQTTLKIQLRYQTLTFSKIDILKTWNISTCVKPYLNLEIEATFATKTSQVLPVARFDPPSDTASKSKGRMTPGRFKLRCRIKTWPLAAMFLDVYRGETCRTKMIL